MRHVLNTRVGITIEEEQAQIAAQKEAERKAAEEKAAKEAAKAAKESKKTETTQGEAVSAGADDLTLLAAIIECEAGGESYECQLAVGAAVINRVKSGSYPNSISGVIYQKGQFGPASSGKLARKLSGRISSSCYSAAQEAMSGVDNTGGCTSFNDHGSGISIGKYEVQIIYSQYKEITKRLQINKACWFAASLIICTAWFYSQSVNASNLLQHTTK